MASSKLVESPGAGDLVAFKNDVEGVGDLLSEGGKGDSEGLTILEGDAESLGSGTGLGEEDASMDLLVVLE